MPFAHSVKRVTVSGTSFNGAEIWTTGFYVGDPAGDGSAVTQSFADSIRTAWTTFFTAAGSGFGSNWKTTNVKVAMMGADGKTNLSNVVYAPYGTAIQGGISGAQFPPQIALVATLANSGARGLAAKGRMYLPGVNIALGTNGQILTTSAQTVADNLKTFLAAVNSSAPIGEKVILASQGRRVKGTDGKYTPVAGTAVTAVVNTVRVGTVYDTQRRRRNALVEQYMSSAMP